MDDKPGRNDPCHCGSGKKYEKCCLDSIPSAKKEETAELAWHNLRQLKNTVFDNHLIPYATETLPDTVASAAIEDFFPEELPKKVDYLLLYFSLFMPWFLFNWIPANNFSLNEFKPGKTIAKNYVKTHGTTLNRLERRFITAMHKTFYSFYCVLDVTFEQSLFVKDIILETTHHIKERQATYQLKRGDIVFGQILTLDKQAIFIGMAPFIIPANYHNGLIDFREWLIATGKNKSSNDAVLPEHMSADLFDYFFGIMEILYNRPSPIFSNTEGEPLQFTTSHFTLRIKPEDALVRLLPLTLSKDSKPFLQAASRNEADEISRIEFPWLKKGNKQHKIWENTVLGQLILEDNRLTLETNSEKRTQKGKKLLSKYLGDAIVFQQTIIESPEQKRQSTPQPNINTTHENNQLMATPPVQEQLLATTKSYWQNWFDAPIPALDQQTPRQAAKTKKGREKLEALLLEYEHYNQQSGDHPYKVDIAYLKSELALD